MQTIERLETERLFARKITQDDYQLLLPMYQDHLIMEELDGIHTEEEAKKEFEKHVKQWDSKFYGMWLWFEKDSGSFIGRAGIRNFVIENVEFVEIGYVLLPKYWGKGYATEAAKAVIKVAFEIIKLKEIICRTSINNKPSQLVAEKLGFKPYFPNFNAPTEVFYRLTAL